MKDFLSQVRYRRRGEYCMVRFFGSLNTAYREPLIMFFDDRLREGCLYFILDFEKTDYISSTIWGAFFRIMRFDRIFKTYPDIYGAVREFGLEGLDIS